jgi:hypothetical protein
MEMKFNLPVNGLLPIVYIHRLEMVIKLSLIFQLKFIFIKLLRLPTIVMKINR